MQQVSHKPSCLRLQPGCASDQAFMLLCVTADVRAMSAWVPITQGKAGQKGGGNWRNAFLLGRATGCQARDDLGSSSQKVVPRGWAQGTSYCSSGPSLQPPPPICSLGGRLSFFSDLNSGDCGTYRLSNLLEDPSLLKDSSYDITVTGSNVI